MLRRLKQHQDDEIYDTVRFELENANDKARAGMSGLRYPAYVNEGEPLAPTRPPKQTTAQELEELKELVVRMKDAELAPGRDGDKRA